MIFVRIRVREHKSYVRFDKINSVIFCHVSDTNHPHNWDLARVIFKSNSKQKNINRIQFHQKVTQHEYKAWVLLGRCRHVMNNLLLPNLSLLGSLFI